jgi:hypothetical protein
MRFVRAISRYSESSTYTRKSDGSGSSRYIAKVWWTTHQRRAPRVSREGWACPTTPQSVRRATLQPNPPKLCGRQFFGPRARGARPRERACWGRRCSAQNLLRNVVTRPSFASQVNDMQIRNKNNMSKCHVNTERLAAQADAKRDWCKMHLSPPSGIPSHGTIGRLIATLKPDAPFRPVSVNG